MFCTNCGQQLPPNATACLNCGTRVRRFPPPPNIQNYLVPSVLVTFCCCLPAGIVGVIYAAQVNSKLAAGDVAGAQAAAKNAKIWTWVGFGAGIVASGIYALLAILGQFTQR